jgi:hypothetical protein
MIVLSGATMTDRQIDEVPREGSADERSQVSDNTKSDSGHTKSGQEAAQGDLPAKHDREHQSNYGGGGENGGAALP